jgi:two-component system chemotaxis sensor kinase CheA
VDMAKYRVVFVEESTEHLAEMSAAMLELEKSMESSEAIDVIFRMAHSIKGMAASMGYDAITRAAHELEDRMQEIRKLGSVGSHQELSILFSGLERLESMVATGRETGEGPADPNEPPTARSTRTSTRQSARPSVSPVPAASPGAAPKKKELSPIP